MSKKQITKGQVGNALTSTAANHILGVTNDIFDEEQQEYQQELNKRFLAAIGSGGGSDIKIDPAAPYTPVDPLSALIPNPTPL